VRHAQVRIEPSTHVQTLMSRKATHKQHQGWGQLHMTIINYNYIKIDPLQL